MGTQWKYKIVTSTTEGEFAENVLNELGSCGWELVTAYKSPGVVTFVLKSPA